MEIYPPMKLGWLNGWIPLVAFYISFGVLMLTWPRAIVQKLYDISGWSGTERILSAAGKPFALAGIGFLIFTPLNLGQGTFWFGVAMYLLGYVVMIVALFNYRNTPPHEAVVGGLYRFSRNPQWVGLASMYVGSCLMVGSGVALLCIFVAIILYHFRILGEERACLKMYGNHYQQSLRKVPRYFWVI